MSLYQSVAYKDADNTSSITNNQMWTGEWSILIISNNGDGNPIAYERDFALSVGVPVTATVCVSPSHSGCIQLTFLVYSHPYRVLDNHPYR